MVVLWEFGSTTLRLESSPVFCNGEKNGTRPFISIRVMCAIYTKEKNNVTVLLRSPFKIKVKIRLFKALLLNHIDSMIGLQLKCYYRSYTCHISHKGYFCYFRC